ncbi:MAG: outer membrane beta-barrel protein [Marinobacter sp.]|uniref:outer membrane beta-barrel protein n=1 Tax=Marinobacter sp. TaxID=50741 RepID=UPI00299ED813|nr:outer membrane beta-barrel protein [Marinobacter sp.]MDX1634895.1 outer membrane beta-barrel protein [Marinobacter sp.]
MVRHLGLLPALSLSASLVVAPAMVSAAPLQLTGTLDTRYSDNAAKTHVDEQSDLETRVGLAINYATDPGQCNASLGGSLAYSYWLDDTFDPETSTDLGAQGTCQLAQGLYWDLSDNLSDVRRTSQRPDTPDNRVRKNLFSTGPRYVLQLSRTDQLQLSAKYQNTEYEDDAQQDSERVIGSVAWNHLFSSTLNGGIDLTTDRAELDTGTEIDRNTASLIASKAWATTQLSGSIGVSEIETEAGGFSNKSDGLVGSLSFDRQINPSADFYITASRELTDQTSDFDVRFAGFVFNLQQTTAVEVTAIRAGLDKRFSNGSQVNIGVDASRQDYLETDEQEERVGGDLRYIRPLAPRWEASAGVGLSYLTYDSDDSDDTVSEVDLGLNYQASRKLIVSGRIGHNQRTSDVVQREYDENWILLGVDYRFR